TRGELSDIEGSPVRMVKLGTHVYRVVAEKRQGRGRYTLWVDGYRFEVEALDERTRAIRDLSAANAAPTGPAPIIAPMPGLIVRVNVSVGDRVEAGQGIVVMEAMKMENELRATAPGTVQTIEVVAGTAVEKGALLVSLT
ncbi:MAG: acetyl-CoA carboxylase biotin carboxyl carrier protein subunit, partial [Gemmatimonadaceae bacterium]